MTFESQNFNKIGTGGARVPESRYYASVSALRAELVVVSRTIDQSKNGASEPKANDRFVSEVAIQLQVDALVSKVLGKQYFCAPA